MNVSGTNMGSPGSETFFSIIIPAYNEEACLEKTCMAIIDEFATQNLPDYEILVINDNSTDSTESVLQRLSASFSQVRYLNNTPPNGYGLAVRLGLMNFRGCCVCIAMADLSDSPQDMVAYYHKMKEGHECVFGSRFIKGSKVVGYPRLKLIENRLANWLIKTLFWVDHNDITNGFKCYQREVISGMQPLLSLHFNLALEMPLKAIVREKLFSRGDYRRKAIASILAT
jgi:dolichol-phosphate mannosyltransferase